MFTHPTQHPDIPTHVYSDLIDDTLFIIAILVYPPTSLGGPTIYFILICYFWPLQRLRCYLGMYFAACFHPALSSSATAVHHEFWIFVKTFQKTLQAQHWQQNNVMTNMCQICAYILTCLFIYWRLEGTKEFAHQYIYIYTYLFLLQCAIQEKSQGKRNDEESKVRILKQRIQGLGDKESGRPWEGDLICWGADNW